MLTYKKTDNLEVTDYSDSDFTGCVDSQKLTSGYVFTLINGAILWKSSKERLTTSSMIYVEFIACFEALGQVIWLKIFIPNLRVIDSIHKSLTMYYDNKGAIFFSHNKKSSETLKHIDLRHLIVRERVQDHTINLEHIGIKNARGSTNERPTHPIFFRNMFDEVWNRGVTMSRPTRPKNMGQEAHNRGGLEDNYRVKSCK
jgi:hypothetical protein